MHKTGFVIAVAFIATVAGGAWETRAGDTGVRGFRILELDGKPVRWPGNSAGPPSITYAFVEKDSHFQGAKNCGSMQSPDSLLKTSRIDRAKFEGEVRAAFDMWERAAGLVFSEIPNPANAGILIGAQLEGEGHAFANVDYRAGAGKERLIEKSLICLNPDLRWKVGFGGSLSVYDIRYTIAHEIGHAIGLDHPASSNQLMSFTYGERFRDLQEGDVEGAVRIYGARQIEAGQYGPVTSSIATKAR